MSELILVPEGMSDVAAKQYVHEGLENNPAFAYLISLRSKLSRRAVTSTLNRIADILGCSSYKLCPWSEIRREHVQAILETLISRDLAPATINTYLAVIKGVMTEAWQKKQIDTDSLERIRTIKRIRGSRLPTGRALEGREVKDLLNVCDNETIKGIRDSAIIAILVGCGLRRTEIITLDIEDINLAERSLKVLGKGNKERLAYLPPKAVGYLKKWLEVLGQEAGPIFVRVRRHDVIDHSRLTSQAIFEIISTRRVEAGIDQFSPHDLRRTFATKMLDNGEDIITVKDAMGHASVTTTQQYDRRDQGRLKRASERLDITE